MSNAAMPRSRALLGWAAAVVAPIAVTAALVPSGGAQSRDYVFIYLAVVAALAVLSGLGPALVAAILSFGLVDYYFVPPVHTLTIADQTDVINLLVFVGTAGLIGGLGSRRRRAQLSAEALTLELRRANSQLERLNREQAEAAAVAMRLARTEQQVHALEETDRLRAELLANVSHELRTPLASILTGATDLLTAPDTPPAVRREIGAVVAEAERLARLVSDMLDLARIEGHALQLDATDIDLREAVDASIARLHRTSPDRVVEVDLAEPLEVLGDWDRLGQILDNLIGNADRYSPPGPPIRVEATHGKRGTVVVRVIDHGPGIPADQRDHVFDRFVRSDGTGPGAAGGTGLGLAIVRGLVEAHAGRVWIEESREGEGSRFAFVLPAAVPETSVVGGQDVNVDVDK
jgi:two-component system sensor histidine kinase KdpD